MGGVGGSVLSKVISYEMEVLCDTEAFACGLMGTESKAV